VPAFISDATKQYAVQKSEMGGVPVEAARRQAEQETAALFPDGQLQPGHAVLFAVDDHGTRLGRVWVATHRTEPNRLFVYDVHVEPEHRGKGSGRELMTLTHDWARRAGYRSVSLHVFGGNHAAISLYRSLGYEVTELSMRREL